MGRKKWRETRPAPDYEQLLKPDGSVGNHELPQLSTAELLRWYQAMVDTRTLDSLGMRLQRRGVLSVAGTSLGEEACGLGAAAALSPGDWLHPSYRQTSGLLYWNVPVDRVIAQLLGHAPEHAREQLPLAADGAPQVKITPYPVFLASNVPLAVGTALTDKLRKRPHVSLVFVGEGATSEGDFHDGLGLAGVHQAPCVVFIQNNQWCISVPANRQTRASTFAQKAVAHGIPHRRVDGNDVFAVYVAVKSAVEQARAGGGPAVIEGVTYRMLDHNSADAALLYRDDTEVEYWRSLDPLQRFEHYLAARGLLDEPRKLAAAAESERRMRAAIDRARNIPPTPAESMFTNQMSGGPGWSLRQQRREAEIEWAGGNPFWAD